MIWLNGRNFGKDDSRAIEYSNRKDHCRIMKQIELKSLELRDILILL